MNIHKQTGFTLIELMVTVAIVGIIAAIAIPSYSEHVLTTKRTEGASSLLTTSLALERCYTLNGAYNNENCEAGPIATENGHYNITIVSTATTFTLTATPTFADADCGNLGLDQTDAKTVSSAGGSVEDCW